MNATPETVQCGKCGQPSGRHTFPGGGRFVCPAPPYTPGPWRAEERDFGTLGHPVRQIVRDVEYGHGLKPVTYIVAEVRYPATFPGTVGAEERAATARLIAAAPDLLEVLVECLAGSPGRASAWRTKAESVIRKARGES